MASEKPRNLAEYLKWLDNKFKLREISRMQRYYESVVEKMRSDFEDGPFWANIPELLRTADSSYRVDTGYPLLVPGQCYELLTKPFDSFIEKTYRKNVVHNSNWPDPPPEGWIEPSTWHERINDMVRTLLQVKYFDGVQYLLDELADLATKQNIESVASYEARESGYYAAHFYVLHPFEIPRLDWDTMKISTKVEIQITTQVQEVIRRLLHKYYEKKRVELEAPDRKWQWDYNSEEFIPNYLGHILHYVEGMIMEVREREEWEAQDEGLL